MESSTRPGIARVTTSANINTNPASYGCSQLGEYFWFNNGHLTSRVHEIRGAEYEEVVVVVVEDVVGVACTVPNAGRNTRHMHRAIILHTLWMILAT